MRTVWILFVLGLAALGYLSIAQTSIDFAGPLRRFLLKIDAARLQRKSPLPSGVERSYWTEGEYRVDRKRLETLGYAVTSETSNSPFVQSNYSYAGRPPQRWRVPIFHVYYELKASPLGLPTTH